MMRKSGNKYHSHSSNRKHPKSSGSIKKPQTVTGSTRMPNVHSSQQQLKPKPRDIQTSDGWTSSQQGSHPNTKTNKMLSASSSNSQLPGLKGSQSTKHVGSTKFLFPNLKK
mmetsp:Transcript_11284/g.9681  ORF Transcript_11284/g.9681 Transcript_11284/m.9681 type:complete len:111 (-) Transcript_11284:166-498(-)